MAPVNPKERLNADLNHALGSRLQVRTKDKLKQVTQAHMQMLHNHTERVRCYFNDPKVTYAG